ncbi:MAG: hypothetical protein ACI936_000010 [Paraglaciecola sp.]|jgi:hypothetical protein
MKLSDKLFNLGISALVQLVIVLGVVYYVGLDYVDNAIAAQQQSSPKIKTIELSYIVNELNDNKYSDEDVIKYVDALMAKYKSEGVILIDANAILSGPDDIFVKAPPFTQLIKEK